jgi:hypothetical protein
VDQAAPANIAAAPQTLTESAALAYLHAAGNRLKAALNRLTMANPKRAQCPKSSPALAE